MSMADHGCCSSSRGLAARKILLHELGIVQEMQLSVVQRSFDEWLATARRSKGKLAHVSIEMKVSVFGFV